MTEPLFFKNESGLTIGEIVALTGAEVLPGAALERRLFNIAPLDLAGPGDLTFCDRAKYVGQLAATEAGACLISPRFEAAAPRHLTLLRVPEPYRAFVTVARALFPSALRPSSLFAAQGTSPGAFVHASARLEAGVCIDPGAVIGPEAEIGAGTVIGPHAVIGPGVRIGRHCAIGAGTSITHALIGDRVIIHAGCRIGQDGFGYVKGEKGPLKVPQVRRVIIQDDVEIGANTTIDRGATRDTVIGEGTKIDNLVQIAHNVTIGRYCFVASQTGISGSSEIGDYVMMGGQVGIADHLKVGSGALVAAKAGVMTDVPARARWGGAPARPMREFLKGVAIVDRLVRKSKRAAVGEEDEEEGRNE